MSRQRQLIGQYGETESMVHLRANGYAVRETNWRCPLGEIDLIVEKDNCIVFVEVKTRRTLTYGAAAAAVDRKKQMQIARAAACYIKATCLSDKDFRFDVITITPEGIEHLENAFTAEGYTI
jgi:putative endonuclease